MTNLAHWLKVLAPTTDWRECYPIVGAIAKAYLEANVIAPAQIGMTDLAKGAFPALFQKVPIDVNANVVIKARRRLFQALRANAEHDLAAYALRGVKPVAGFNGQMGLPWYWTAPNLVE